MIWILAIVAIVVLFIFRSALLGQQRAGIISKYYGIPKQVIINAYSEHCMECQKLGVPASLRSFEIVLRSQLGQVMPSAKHIRPLYCEGLDPLNPYLQSESHAVNTENTNDNS
jgi:hypothetical protein